MKGLLPVLSHKFKLFQNRIVLLLQYLKLKLKRKNHESAQEKLGRLETKKADCDYNEYNRRLTE